MRRPVCNDDKPRRFWSNSQWNNSNPVVTDNNGWRRNCCATCTDEIGFYYTQDPPPEPTVEATEPVLGPQEPSPESHPGLQEQFLQLTARVEELERRIRTIEKTPHPSNIFRSIDAASAAVHGASAAVHACKHFQWNVGPRRARDLGRAKSISRTPVKYWLHSHFVSIPVTYRGTPMQQRSAAQPAMSLPRMDCSSGTT